MVVCQTAAVRLESVRRIWGLVYLQVLVLYALFPGKVGVETATVDCLELHPAVHVSISLWQVVGKEADAGRQEARAVVSSSGRGILLVQQWGGDI